MLALGWIRSWHLVSLRARALHVTVANIAEEFLAIDALNCQERGLSYSRSFAEQCGEKLRAA